MVTIFWLLTGLVFYVYVGYPLLLHVWARSTRRERRRAARSRPAEPSVSIVIAARNEGPRIRGRIDNLRQQGKMPEARQLLRGLADGKWPEQYANVQQQARQQLRGR